MNDHVYKTIHITGTSTKSSDDAVHVAISRVRQTIHGLRWFKVTEIRGDIDGGGVHHWQVGLEIGFTLD